jgi:predicted dehydrogenase
MESTQLRTLQSLKFDLIFHKNSNTFQVVGVVEPNKYRREKFLKTHGHTIPTENIFTDWKMVLEREKVSSKSNITNRVLVSRFRS